jgi:hypothetical protein
VRMIPEQTFVRIVWVLIGVTAIGPATWYIVDPILRRHQGIELPMIIVAPFTLINFLLYALGRVVCAVLAASLLIIIFLRGINIKTKLITVITGALTCAVLLYWVTVVQHSW